MAPPAELPLEQVDGFLHHAGVASAWSITQFHDERAPAIWSLDALTDLEPLGDKLCRSQFVELILNAKDGTLALESTVRRTEYAFAPCRFALPEDFHEVVGRVDPERMQEDFSAIVSAIRGDKRVKASFAEPAYRAEFAKLRRNDIASIKVEDDGHLRVCFISGLVDQLGAVEELSADVVRGTAADVKVDLCGYIEITQVRK